MSITIQTLPIPYCPDCGARMILRRPPQGKTWRPFWGCSQWPDCKGTRQIGADGKPVTDDEEWEEDNA